MNVGDALFTPPPGQGEAPVEIGQWEVRSRVLGDGKLTAQVRWTFYDLKKKCLRWCDWKTQRFDGKYERVYTGEVNRAYRVRASAEQEEAYMEAVRVYATERARAAKHRYLVPRGHEWTTVDMGKV